MKSHLIEKSNVEKMQLELEGLLVKDVTEGNYDSKE